MVSKPFIKERLPCSATRCVVFIRFNQRLSQRALPTSSWALSRCFPLVLAMTMRRPALVVRLVPEVRLVPAARPPQGAAGLDRTPAQEGAREPAAARGLGVPGPAVLGQGVQELEGLP